MSSFLVLSFVSVDNVFSSTLFVFAEYFAFVLFALSVSETISVLLSFSSLLDEPSVFNRSGLGGTSVSLRQVVALLFPGNFSFAYPVLDASLSDTMPALVSDSM